MQTRVFKVCQKGEKDAFLQLYQENENILAQRTRQLLNSPIHIAAKFGCAELVSKIMELNPDMVSVENAKMETPIHEACRHGRLKVLENMLVAGAWAVAAYKLNREKESTLSIACSGGHREVVKFLLSKEPDLLMLEEQEDGFSTSLHVAASRGYEDIVGDLLKACPRLARYRDGEGKTPLHLAAIKGHVPVIDVILWMDMESTKFLTQNGESVLHLSVKSNQYETVVSLVRRPEINNLLNFPDDNGNTVLHLAATGKFSLIVKFLLSTDTVDLKAKNKGGLTALDILQKDPGDIDDNEIVKLLRDRPSFSGLSFKSLRHGREERETKRFALNVILVVAVLIASVTFEAAHNPPGGVWQDWQTNDANSTMTNSNQYKPGTSIGIELNRGAFNRFTTCNALGFYLSIYAIIFGLIDIERVNLTKKLVTVKVVVGLAALAMALDFIFGEHLVDYENGYWQSYFIVMLGIFHVIHVYYLFRNEP